MGDFDPRAEHIKQMRNAAEGCRAGAVKSRSEAAGWQTKADVALALAAKDEELARGWNMLADALESGVITLGDAGIVAGLRKDLADAQEAIDAHLPFARRPEQLAEAEQRNLAVQRALLDGLTDAQRDGVACYVCAGPISIDEPDERHIVLAGRQMFVHVDRGVCERVLGAAAEAEHFAEVDEATYRYAAGVDEDGVPYEAERGAES